MRIALYPNSKLDHNLELTRQLISLIALQGSVAVIEPDVVPELSDLPSLVRDSYSSSDLLICLGGDGTFISAVHRDSAADLPICGVNLGQVGFLPEISQHNMAEAVELLVNSKFTLEERVMLDVNCYDSDGKLFAHDHAINDAVLSRGASSRIVTIELEIGDDAVENIPADGIIVSTPTGSTAYSMSAGGPIIHPGMRLLLITPICPHTLHNRSYIAGADTTICLGLQEYPVCATLSVDGRSHYDIFPNDRVEVSCSKRALNFIRIWEDRFFQTLPEKIQKRGVSK